MKTALMMFAAASLALPSAAVANAQQAKSVEVDYRDLNLATTQGQDLLTARIERAARKVCGLSRHMTGSRLRDRDAQRCVSETTKNINAQFAALVEESAKGG